MTSELEKLVSLRDRGDLSQAEFEKAKALLLSNQETGAVTGHETTSEEGKERRTWLLVANLMTVTVALSVVSVALNPSAIKLVLVVLWTVASALAWVTYSRTRKRAESEERG